jgi:hypothetical protein
MRRSCAVAQLVELLLAFIAMSFDGNVAIVEQDRGDVEDELSRHVAMRVSDPCVSREGDERA